MSAAGLCTGLTAASPAVAKLVETDDVSEVLIASDRVTINVDADDVWDATVPKVTSIVSEALRCGPVPASALSRLSSLADAAEASLESWPEGSVEADIFETLETHVRPHVRDDGGDLRFCGFDHERGVAQVQLVGACSGCPSSASTLHGRVEQLLKHFVPEVMSVEAVSDAEAAALAATSADGAGVGAPAGSAFGPEKVALEEHVRRMLAEGAATSIEWNEAHRRPLA